MANLPVVISSSRWPVRETWHRLAWGGRRSSRSSVLAINISLRAESSRANRDSDDERPGPNASRAPQRHRSSRCVTSVSHYGSFPRLKRVNLDVPEKRVTALSGRRAAASRRLLRTFNRMFELYPEQRAEGEIVFEGDEPAHVERDVSLAARENRQVFRSDALSDVDSTTNHRVRRAALRRTCRAGAWTIASNGAHQGGALERGEGQAPPDGTSLSAGQLAAPVHRAAASREARDPGSSTSPARRSIRSRPRRSRNVMHRAQERLHRRHRHAQHARQAARVSDYTAYMYLGELIGSARPPAFPQPQKQGRRKTTSPDARLTVTTCHSIS